MSSETECLKISKVAFPMVSINQRIDLTASKEMIKVWYLMPISRETELGRKMLNN